MPIKTYSGNPGVAVSVVTTLPSSVDKLKHRSSAKRPAVFTTTSYLPAQTGLEFYY